MLTFQFSGTIITRASQLLAEVLVIGVTWWYTYQSYRIRKGIKLGKTISTLLIYNGEMRYESLNFQLTCCTNDQEAYISCEPQHRHIDFVTVDIHSNISRCLATFYTLAVVFHTASSVSSFTRYYPQQNV